MKAGIDKVLARDTMTIHFCYHRFVIPLYAMIYVMVRAEASANSNFART